MPTFEIDSDNKRSLLRSFLKQSMASIRKINFNDLCNLRFCKTACLPYPVSDEKEKWNVEAEKTNFVEFLNQFFTATATIIALEKECFKDKKCIINLGEMPGRDIVYESEDDSIIAEIFAVTKPTSNSKLKKEIISLAEGKKDDPKAIKGRHIFFILAQDEFNNLTEEIAKKWVEYSSKGKTLRKIEYCDNSFPKAEDQKDPKECTWRCNCTLADDTKEICVHCISESYVKDFIAKL